MLNQDILLFKGTQVFLWDTFVNLFTKTECLTQRGMRGSVGIVKHLFDLKSYLQGSAATVAHLEPLKRLD